MILQITKLLGKIYNSKCINFNNPFPSGGVNAEALWLRSPLYIYGTTWLSNVRCRGDEASLLDCPKDWGSGGCGVEDDAWVSCCEFIF